MSSESPLAADRGRIRRDIEREIARYDRALHDHDVDAIMDTFTADAVTYDLAPPLANSGTDRVALAEWLGTWDGPITGEVRDLAVDGDDEIAYAFSLRRMRGRKKTGEAVDMWYRNTLCFRRDGDRWRVLHAHSSVPMAMDGSGTALTDLKP